MSKSSDKQFAAFSEDLEGLVGPVEDWSGEELNQFLVDAGVDMQTATRKLYDRVGEIAGSYNAKNQNVPVPVANLLRQMRPIDAPLRDPAEAKGRARKWIAHLRGARQQVGAPQVAHAFRNRREQLTAGDQEILRQIEAKLLRARQSDDDA